MKEKPTTDRQVRRALIWSAVSLISLAILSRAGAQVNADPKTLKDTATSLPSEMIALRTEGWEAIYRTDYHGARLKFAELQKRFPTHPAGDLSMASVVWQEYLFRTRRLQTNLYKRNSSFYAGASHTKAGAEGDAIEPAVDAAFQEHISKALSEAEALVAAHPKDAESLYFLGAVYGLRAAYEASAQRKFWAALGDGLRGVKLLEQVVSLDPTFYDAYLTLGTYHYAIGCIPQPFRAMVGMAGMHGGRQKGITELEMVANKGAYNRDDARAVLFALYGYEGHPQQALPEVEALTARYPQSVVLRLEMASTLVQLQRQKEATAIFEQLLQGSDRRLIDLVHYEYAQALAHDRAYLEAASHFAAVDQTPGAYPPLAAQALVNAGQMYDLAGHRDDAVRSYQAGIMRSGSDDLRKTAERFISQPFSLK